MGVVNEPQVLI